MDYFVESIESSSELLAKSTQLRDLSRMDKITNIKNLRRLSELLHSLHQQAYCEELNCVALALANILLKEPRFRAQVLAEKLDLVHDIQTRLLVDSRKPGFELQWEVPLWRVLFLLAHGQRSENLVVSMFDRNLAPAKFQHLVDLLDNTTASPHPMLQVVMEELGKFWYALCYNYGLLVRQNSEAFRSSLTKLNQTLRSGKGLLLDKFSVPLIQLASLLLLYPENDLLVTFDMALNLMFILKRAVTTWSQEVSQRLYSSPDTYNIPQTLHLIRIIVAQSPGPVRDQLQQCLSGHPTAPVDLKEQILDLHNSPITSSDVRGTVSSVLEALSLSILEASPRSPQDIVLAIQPKPMNRDRDSAETVIGQEFVTRPKMSHQANASSSSISTMHSDRRPSHCDDSWSEEERFEEATRIMGAIRRLDELGVIKPTLPNTIG
ncbi:LADA_0H12134g1_1 [Lachancea dasiensis]|uniref:LADA_0H12134g1_1 n=1 Tax=Lachancea dasiensis TaxID=1072105 RepID=A0A1G4K3X8_9SACH|nr:LADA_0H12134g1_1 [Lachancea dasiensis]